MSVSEMRKYLSEMRMFLDTQTEDTPFGSSLVLSNGQPVLEFARAVAIGIHEKRSKVKKAAQPPEQPE
jgi:hypothetical protein